MRPRRQGVNSEPATQADRHTVDGHLRSLRQSEQQNARRRRSRRLTARRDDACGSGENRHDRNGTRWGIAANEIRAYSLRPTVGRAALGIVVRQGRSGRHGVAVVGAGPLEREPSPRTRAPGVAADARAEYAPVPPRLSRAGRGDHGKNHRERCQQHGASQHAAGRPPVSHVWDQAEESLPTLAARSHPRGHTTPPYAHVQQMILPPRRFVKWKVPIDSRDRTGRAAARPSPDSSPQRHQGTTRAGADER
jgi:hypothetical protein